MSNSTDKTGCLSHRANSRFFIIYGDFLDIATKLSFEHRHKLAAFWRVLETKTNDRITYNEERIEEAKKLGAPVPETDLWVEIPYSEFVHRSLETYKSSSFQIASAESERLGFSKSRVQKRSTNPLDPQSPLEDYKEYLFLTSIMQTAINTGECPTPIEINSPLLKSLQERKEKAKAKRAIENNRDGVENNTPPIENNTDPLLNSTAGAIEINRKKYIEVSSKDNKDTEEESKAVSGETAAPTSFSSEETENVTDLHRWKEDSEKHKAVKPDENETQYHIAAAAIGNATETRVFAGPLTLPSKGATHASMVDTLPADCGNTPVVSRGGVPGSDSVRQDGRPVGHAEVPADTQRGRQATTPLQVQPGQTQEIGATHGHGNDTTAHPGDSMGFNDGLYPAEVHEQIASPQAPGEAVSLPSAVSAPSTDRHGNTGPVQATFVAPAQSGSTSPATGSPPAQASGDTPPPQMALTPKQIKAQNERRAKEIWAIVERTLNTKFRPKQRTSENNVKGMENLIEDEITDDELETALKKVPAFYVQQFNLKKFHEMIPGLTAGSSPPPQNSKPTTLGGTAAPAPDGVQLGVSGLPIWKGRPVKYA